MDMHYECMWHVACVFCMSMCCVFMAQMLTHMRTCMYINVYVCDDCDAWVYVYVNVCVTCVYFV